jgi:hypothetical protein
MSTILRRGVLSGCVSVLSPEDKFWSSYIDVIQLHLVISPSTYYYLHMHVWNLMPKIHSFFVLGSLVCIIYVCVSVEVYVIVVSINLSKQLFYLKLTTFMFENLTTSSFCILARWLCAIWSIGYLLDIVGWQHKWWHHRHIEEKVGMRIKLTRSDPPRLEVSFQWQFSCGCSIKASS